MIKKTGVNFKLLKACLLFKLAFSPILPVQSQVINNLAQVKSPYDEQHPVLSPSGDLYFTIAFHPDNQNGVEDLGDVWLSTGNETMDFQKPSKIKDLSTSGYDVVVGFLNGNSILVYHDGKERMQGLHQYSGSGNSWKYEKKLNLGSFRNHSTHFSGRLSPSGDTLLLSLASFGSYGNEDIYVSFLKEDGNWTSPQNLGPHINTFQQEVTPSLSFDKRVLFFSSNGHGSNAGRDIFYAERLDDSWEKWSAPKPLTTGNTVGVELSYFQLPDDPTKAIFTTTQNSEGYGDILMVHAENIVLVEMEANQKQKDEIPMPPKEITKEKTITTDTLQMEEKGKTEPFIPSMENEVQNIPLPLLMTPASKGASMVLEQVLFKRGTAELLDGNSMEFISSLADFLMDNPTIKILLEGHTDNLGNAQLNKELSLDRASAIRSYLVDKGVEFERIRIAGWGGIKPRASNHSEEGRKLNRRVELVILDR
ncbi:MAG: OmpA family protein [Anditalea sp.]